MAGSLDAFDQSFDYIVVGGGTAGCVVASRLSEDSNVRVLLIEAGGDRRNDPRVLCPGLVASLHGKEEYDWNFSSVPQPTLNNRIINQARGRMLGGSSGLNYMMLLYPSKSIFDAWASLGNPGWDFDTLVPYFRKFATVHAPPQSARDMCGLTYHDESLTAGNGPVHVAFGEGYNPNNKAWLDTFAHLGLEIKADPRTGTALGAFQNQATIDPLTKTRSFSATAYLGPEVSRRSNLAILTDTLVTRVTFDSSTPEPQATGVEITTSGGRQEHMRTTGEVILCAGALQSPQLLELSGVGDATLLSDHNIPLIVHNPNVGEHLQDHPATVQAFEANDDVLTGDVLADPATFDSFLHTYQTSNGAGPLGQSLLASAYVPLIDAHGPLSLASKHALLAGAHQQSLPNTPDVKTLLHLLQSDDHAAIQYIFFPGHTCVPAHPKNTAEYFAPAAGNKRYLSIVTMLNHPFSRGSVHISSANPTSPPTWDPNFNSQSFDMEILARGVQFVERIVSPETPLGKLLKQDRREENGRMPGDDLERAKEIVREKQISLYHLCGSCGMRPREEGGVVDARLRVYGVKGLRVVDASVFPLEPLGNLQSTVYAVAERGADLIKEDCIAAARS